jgi:hypothetical protein
VHIADEPQASDWDLTDLAAVETVLHGGNVHVMTAEEMAEAALPAEAPVALFRY